MSDTIKLELLPNGRIQFKRGDLGHNLMLKEILSNLVDGDEIVMQRLDDFFKGSEDIEILVGDTIFCG